MADFSPPTQSMDTSTNYLAPCTPQRTVDHHGYVSPATTARSLSTHHHLGPGIIPGSRNMLAKIFQKRYPEISTNDALQYVDVVQRECLHDGTIKMRQAFETVDRLRRQTPEPTQEEQTVETPDETTDEFRARLIYAIGQMMFVSGESAEPSAETTGMIEEIVRQQVIEMLTQATIIANRRGSRSIAVSDLIFLIRHDKAKVSRLKTFLSWKDVRKNVKDSDDKAGGDADVGDFDEGAALPGANPTDNKKSTNKKAKLVLPWEVQSYFSEQVPEREDEEDEEEEEQNEATLARLASADERTKNMTRDEYVYWSDCRQASFTFRKGKRFREWAGFGVVTDSKPNDDIVDILGFLTFEIVQTLTEEALKVKHAEDLHKTKSNASSTSTNSSSGASGGGGSDAAAAAKKRKRPPSSGGTGDAGGATTITAGAGEGAEGMAGGSGGLFQMQEEGRTPVEPKHVREAFRRLQAIPNKYKYMRQGYAGIRTPLRLI